MNFKYHGKLENILSIYEAMRENEDNFSSPKAQKMIEDAIDKLEEMLEDEYRLHDFQ